MSQFFTFQTFRKSTFHWDEDGIKRTILRCDGLLIRDVCPGYSFTQNAAIPTDAGDEALGLCGHAGLMGDVLYFIGEIMDPIFHLAVVDSKG